MAATQPRPRQDFVRDTGSIDSPAGHAFAITPNDAADLPNGACRGIYIGDTSGGAVIILDTAGGEETITFAGLLEGTILPVRAIRVNSTGTTAASLVALY